MIKTVNNENLDEKVNGTPNKNELKDMQNKHKKWNQKHKHSLPYFKPDAGNVEYNTAIFNHMNGNKDCPDAFYASSSNYPIEVSSDGSFSVGTGDAGVGDVGGVSGESLSLTDALKQLEEIDETTSFNQLNNLITESLSAPSTLIEGTSNFFSMDEFPLLVFEYYDFVYDELYDKVKNELNLSNDIDVDVFDIPEFESKFEKEWDEYQVCVLDEDEVDELTNKISEFNDRMNYDERHDSYEEPEVDVQIKSGYYEGAQIYVPDEKDLADWQKDEINKFLLELKSDFGLTPLGVAWHASNGETGYNILKESILLENKDSLKNRIKLGKNFTGVVFYDGSDNIPGDGVSEDSRVSTQSLSNFVPFGNDMISKNDRRYKSFRLYQKGSVIWDSEKDKLNDSFRVVKYEDGETVDDYDWKKDSKFNSLTKQGALSKALLADAESDEGRAKNIRYQLLLGAEELFDTANLEKSTFGSQIAQQRRNAEKEKQKEAEKKLVIKKYSNGTLVQDYDWTKDDKFSKVVNSSADIIASELYKDAYATKDTDTRARYIILQNNDELFDTGDLKSSKIGQDMLSQMEKDSLAVKLYYNGVEDKEYNWKTDSTFKNFKNDKNKLALALYTSSQSTPENRFRLYDKGDLIFDTGDLNSTVLGQEIAKSVAKPSDAETQKQPQQPEDADDSSSTQKSQATAKANLANTLRPKIAKALNVDKKSITKDLLNTIIDAVKNSGV